MRFLSIGLLIAALVGGPVIPEYPERGEPLGTSALETDLVERGYRNARLPVDLLLDVESNTRRLCRLEQEAGEAWSALLVHAAADGVNIQASSCYRDLRSQQRAYDWNCPVTRVPYQKTVTTTNAKGKTVQTTVTAYTSRRVCKIPTARPGNSNHGWGRAVDVATGGRLLTCRSAAFHWMRENAHLYGFVHPRWAHCGMRKEEAWHWEWAGTAEQPPTVATLHVAL